MFIRPTSFYRTRFRAFTLSFLLSGINVMSLQPAALAQDTSYAPDLLSAETIYASQKQPALKRAMSFSELEAQLRAHPSLDALSLSAQANRQRAEGALGLPDPVVSLQLNNVPLFDPSFSEYLPSNKAVGIRQALPSRSERKANSLKSLRSAAQQELETEQQYTRLRGQLLVYLIEKQSLETLRNLALARQSKYDELSDIIDVERTEVSRTLAQIDGQEAQIDAELINLLGFIPQTETPALSKTPWTGNALGFYAVRVADANVDISDADVQRAEADFKPDWGVNLTYQQRESGQGPRSNFDGEDWVSGGVSFTIPLWAGKIGMPALPDAQPLRDKSNPSGHAMKPAEKQPFKTSALLNRKSARLKRRQKRNLSHMNPGTAIIRQSSMAKLPFSCCVRKSSKNKPYAIK